MYVGTLRLDDQSLLVRVDVHQRGGLMGLLNVARVTITDSDGQVRDMRLPMSPSEPDVGHGIAALIAAIQALSFEGRVGPITLLHHSPAMSPQSLDDVLYAANVKHAIQSLATSATLQ